jgi:hypothetical protein
MKKASVVRDAETDDAGLGRVVLALMEAHRARTADPGAESPQLLPSAREGTPPTGHEPASVDSRAIDLSDRVSPDALPRMPMGIGGPNIEFPSRLRPGQHDGHFAINEPRIRSSPESDVVPKPPVPTRGGASPWVGGLILLFLIAGISAYGLVIITSPDRTALVPPSEEPAASEVAGATVAGKQREERLAIPRLIVEDRRAYVNEPLLLGLSLDGASGGEFLLIKGLDEATRLSAGTLIGPKSWRVSQLDLGNLFVYADKDYVGTMDAVVDLHTTDDRRIDSKRMQLEWIPVTVPGHADAQVSPDRPPVQAPHEKLKLQPDEIAVLLQRGKDMLKVGDVSAARLVLRRAAAADNAEAALLLASTFDPIELHELGVVGFAPDFSQALSWYRKASALGSGEAKRRVERLGRNSP